MTYTYRTRRQGRRLDCPRCGKTKERQANVYCNACRSAWRLNRLGRKIVWVHRCHWCGKFFIKKSVFAGRPMYCRPYHKTAAYRARKAQRGST